MGVNRKFVFDFLSNIASRICSALLGFFVLPLYPALLGFESYGLIGFFATLSASLMILDFGLSTTLNRELAKASAMSSEAKEVRNLVATLEVVYWIVALMIALIVYCSSSLISFHWLKANSYDGEQLSVCIQLMGLVLACQWPQSLYAGGLMGLQRHVSYNSISLLFSTLKNVGGILVLWLVDSSIYTYFIWQLILCITGTLTLRWFLWRHLPRCTASVRFSISQLVKVSYFALGMSGIGLTSLILTQTDKIILSKYLTLEQFGYYTFGAYLGSSVLLLSGVVGSLILPKLSEVVARGSPIEIERYYHHYNRLVAVLITPGALFLCLFSHDVVKYWVRSAHAADSIYLIVSLITIGSLCNAYYTTPYYLMIAHGWTKIAFLQNAMLCLIAFPLVYICVNYFGPPGGAALSIVGNLSYVLISIPLIHRSLLEGTAKTVFFEDIGPPFLIALTSVGFGRLICSLELLVAYHPYLLGITLFVSYFGVMWHSTEFRECMQSHWKMPNSPTK